MKKRMIAFMVALVLLAGLVPNLPANASAGSTRIYSLADDSEVQNLSPDASASEIFSTSALGEAPLGTFSIVPREGGGHAIQLTDRGQDWVGINIMRAAFDMDLSANDYVITISGRVINAAPNAETVMLVGAYDAPWDTLAETAVTGNGSFTLTAMLSRTLTADNIQQFDTGFRINTQGDTGAPDFIIDDIIIEQTSFTRVYSLADDSAVQNLSVGEIENLSTSALATFSDQCTTSIVAREGGGNAIQLTDREADWVAVNIMRAEIGMDLSANNYIIIIRGRVINAARNAETVMILNAQDEPWGMVGNGSYADVSGNDSFTLIGRTSDVDNIQQFGNGFRIQTVTVTSDFIIDDIIIETDAPPAPAPTPTPALTPTTAPAPVPASGDITISLTVGNINAMVDGSALELAAPPFIGEDGRTMVPVRFVADAMGAETDWDAATQTVTIAHPSTGEINLTVGQALPDGMGTPEIVNGRTFVPVRFIAVEMGGAIDWNADTQTITIVLGG